MLSPVKQAPMYRSAVYLNKNVECFPFADLGLNKLTVGKIYAGILIAENWRAYKSSRTEHGGNSQVSGLLTNA